MRSVRLLNVKELMWSTKERTGTTTRETDLTRKDGGRIRSEKESEVLDKFTVEGILRKGLQRRSLPSHRPGIYVIFQHVER